MKRGLRWTLGVLLTGALTAGVVFWERPVTVFEKWSEVRMALEGAASRTATVEGIRMHYYAMGPVKGPVVVLVHGLGGRSEDWANLAPYLVKTGFRVYLPDLPGYGQSGKPADFSYSVRDEARVVVGFLDALGLKQVDLGGWSMGGWIVQLVAVEHPERVKRLMLFDSAGIYAKPTWNTNLFTPQNAEQLNELNALLTPNSPKVPGFVARDILRVSKQDAWVIRRAMATMLTGTDTTNVMLPKLAMPVLLIWGGRDKVVPVAQAETMHRLIPQSALDVIPGCGHLAPRKCSKQIGPDVVGFLKQ